ncbi:MAG: transporter substrate-binding domain-containing protein, partial [Magnetococcales bacterium]|nr:transporter substrate-binding domain-containing protein [Magnetococcales bacterium]
MHRPLLTLLLPMLLLLLSVPKAVATPSPSAHSPSATVSGSPSQDKIVTAHIRHRPPEMIVDGDYVSGPLKEILEKAAARIGYEVEWEPIPFSQSLADLKSGAVDIVPRTIRKPEREAFIDFLGPIGRQQKDILFLVPVGNNHTIRTYDDLSGLKIGIKAKTAYFPRFDSDDTLNKVAATGGDYELARLLIEGRVDTVAVLDRGAMESALAGLGYHHQSYARFRHHQVIENYYALSKKSRHPVLKTALNGALKAMTASGDVAEIYKKHRPASGHAHSAPMVPLTAEEKAWLVANPGPYTVQNETDYPPINFNERDLPEGYSIDFMNLVARKLGIELTFVTGPTWDGFMEMVRNRRLDIMVNIVRTDEREKFLLFTDPYVDNPPAIITRIDYPHIHDLAALKGVSTAIPKGFFYQEILEKSFPDIPLVLTSGLQDSIKSVAGSESDAALGGLAILNHILQ